MLKWRLFLAFSTIILFIVSVLFGTIYFVIYNQVIENSRSSYDMIFSQYASNLSGILETCKSDMLSLAIDPGIQELLKDFSSRSGSEPISDDIDQIIETDNLSAFNRSGYLFSTGMPSGRTRYNIVLYAKGTDGIFQQLTSSMGTEIPLPAPVADTLPLEATEAKTSGFYSQLHTSGKTPRISIYKAVYDLTSFQNIVGILCCEIPLEDIRAHLFSPMNSKYNISICLIDPQNDTRSFYGLPYYDIIDRSTLDKTRAYLVSNHYVMEYSINRGMFYLVGVASMDSVTKTIFTSLTMVSVSALIALILAFLFSLFYSSYITRPIKVLSETMKNTKYDDPELIVSHSRIGEIQELYNSFNNMIQTINQLIYENYIKEINKKQSELNALQSQINTHFLYNTLDTVNWLALDYGAENISLIVKSLSSLLRLSLNNGREMISMRSELEHVKAYIGIQKIRYDNSFSVEFAVDESALDIEVPKMLLQPLVENAIYHGFKSESVGNRILIEVRLEDAFIHEIVKNSGDNINLQKMRDLTCPSVETDCGTHYGVKNISQRLSLNYGGNAGYYYSTEDGYTAAHIRIPLGHFDRPRTTETYYKPNRDKEEGY